DGRGTFVPELLRPRLLHHLVQPPPEQERPAPPHLIVGRLMHVLRGHREPEPAVGPLDVPVHRGVHSINDLPHGPLLATGHHRKDRPAPPRKLIDPPVVPFRASGALDPKRRSPRRRALPGTSRGG